MPNLTFKPDTNLAHPIDIAECFSQDAGWFSKRLSQNKIICQFEGIWRYYTIELEWSAPQEMLRIMCSFEISPPKVSAFEFQRIIDLVNDMSRSGWFTYKYEEEKMLYHSGLTFAEGLIVSRDDIKDIVMSSTSNCEKFYPSFQLVAWANHSIDDALKVVIDTPQGCA